MKLICEQVEDVKYITETSENGQKNLFITGVFMVSEEKNKNGRIYPFGVMESEVKRYMQESVAKNRAYGELGHPQGPAINLDRVSHMIKDLRMEGNLVIGKAQITNTPMGNIVKGLMESGANLGVSSRGLGSLKENKDGIMEVQGDFRLATAADIVADPSAPGAFVKGIMEGVEYFYDDSKGTFVQKNVVPMYETMKKLSVKELNEKKLQFFEAFLAGLSSKQ
jgi:hypothetical protein